MDKDSSKLYTLWTTKGLYKFKTLAQRVSSASAETQDRIRRILAGIAGVIQVKDDMIVNGERKKHDTNLRNLFVRLDKYNIMVRKEKCAFGKPEVCNVWVWLQIQQRLQQ